MWFILVAALTFGGTLALPAKSPVRLTPEQISRLETWTENDKQSMWEISGQFEGDIILQDDTERNGVIDPRYRWPNKELLYEISSDFNAKEKEFIENALKVFEQKSCVKVRPRKSTDKDYVNVTGQNKGCFSYLGRIGGRQTLNLQKNGCMYKGIIQHEFLHALGFYHQQSASDRDDYVTVLWENIKEGKERNFDKKSSSVVTDFGVPYDYGSVMHYGAYAFSKNGNKTIQTKNNEEIGQNEGPSEKDIKKLKAMYECK